jgi:hypothetical protein
METDGTNTVLPADKYFQIFLKKSEVLPRLFIRTVLVVRCGFLATGGRWCKCSRWEAEKQYEDYRPGILGTNNDAIGRRTRHGSGIALAVEPIIAVRIER